MTHFSHAFQSHTPLDQTFEIAANYYKTKSEYIKSFQMYTMTGRFNIQYIIDNYLPYIDCIEILMTHAFRNCINNSQ